MDYYPFGMLVPNRHYNAPEYRYGFQGQEKDDELKGEGNSLNYTFRMHDPRIGRFFAVDPLFRQYPANSPYAFSENRVVDMIEREGLECTFYMLGMTEVEGIQYFTLVQVYQVGQGVETINGKKIKIDTGPEKNYVKGSDGHWHQIPDNVMNSSIDRLGKNADEIFAVLNKGAIADKGADMAGGLKAMEEIGNRFQTVLAAYSLYSAGKSLAKNAKKIVNPNRIQKSQTTTGIAIETVPSGTTRLPKTNGKWEGTRGNGTWYSENEKVIAITNGKGVKFKDGYPEFTEYSQGQIVIKNLDGTSKDFDKVYDVIMIEKGLKSRNAAKQLLKDRGLTPHHHQDGKTIQFVPTDLHQNVPHAGGASILRKG